MKNIKKNDHAMTLVELLITTILVVMVMLGTASVDYALRGARQTSLKSATLTMTASAAMSQIARDVLIMTGEAGNVGINNYTNNPAPVEAGDYTGPIQNICFRYDPALIPTPSNYNDDLWNCYSLNSTPAAPGPAGDQILYRCKNIPAASGPLNANETCQTARILAIDPNPKALLKLTNANADFFNVIKDANGDLLYVEINFQSQADTTQAVDPMSNPAYSLTTRLNPAAQGR